jgi:hypothetical protein
MHLNNLVKIELQNNFLKMFYFLFEFQEIRAIGRFRSVRKILFDFLRDICLLIPNLEPEIPQIFMTDRD